MLVKKEDLKHRYEELIKRYEQILEEHRKDNIAEGVFITSVELAELTGKEHYNVIRDIDSVIRNLLTHNVILPTWSINEKGEPMLAFIKTENGGLKSEGVLENSLNYEIYDESKVNTPLQEGERFRRVLIKEDSGKDSPIYYLDEVAYLTMMGHYNLEIRIRLCIFYLMCKESRKIIPEQLFNFTREQVEESIDIKYYIGDYFRGEKAIDDRLEQEFKRMAEDFSNKYPKGDEIDMMGGLSKRFTDFSTKRHEGAYATSKDIALLTGKLHKNVLADIERTLKKVETIPDIVLDKDFKPTIYKSKQNKDVPMYDLSELGFLIIMSGYFDWIVYELSVFYINAVKAIRPEMSILLSLSDDVLQELSEILFQEEMIVSIPVYARERYPSLDEESLAQIIKKETDIAQSHLDVLMKYFKNACKK